MFPIQLLNSCCGLGTTTITRHLLCPINAVSPPQQKGRTRNFGIPDRMDYLITLLLLLSLTWTCMLCFTSTRRKSRLPPGPNPFPVIGNIHQLGDQPHQSLAKLSKRYGPLMSLKLGTRTTIVISSPGIAKEVLQKHDQVFSSRTIPDASHALDHYAASLAWLPVEKKWRNYRKICKEHMFSSQQLDATQVLRRKKVQELLEYVRGCCLRREAVDIGKAAFTTSLNLISNTFFSIDLADHGGDSKSSHEFKEIVCVLMELAGKPNLVDFFPVLRLIDPQGLRRQSRVYTEKLFAIFDGIIARRLEARSSASESSTSNDVLEALLNLSRKDDAGLSYNDMKHLLLVSTDLFYPLLSCIHKLHLFGTDTSSLTVEWAMTELLCNPEKLAKARTELEEVVGKNEPLQESDISKLPYLQAIVKETFRLHPAAPFLVPHKADTDVEIDSFVVPKNAQILVNVWATGRDSNVWLNPGSFMPERFLDSEIDFRGRDFELIPFGAGRRICPGLPLAYRVVHLMLGSILHSFNWRLEDGMKPEDMDMSEKFGLTLQKAIPLRAVPTVQS
ncbi:hypothetical protein RJ640_024047 [Escallonia rubra]|uniref:Cytochrome P450 n=1 Tax=Escallonia rubra TaxID=112253 RepID=A0AA88RT10_9ASTE|nr:hypothetical protein RJ640_024047 [Escallonia rubra]